MIVKKWILKAITQKVISYLPGSQRINYFFQKYVTKGVYLSEEYFEDRLIHAKSHQDGYKQWIGPLKGITTLELGTGWYPVVPISHFLGGADHVLTVDISPLLSKEHLLTTIDRFLERLNQLDNYIEIVPARLDQLKKLRSTGDSLTLAELLTELKMRYLIADARSLDLQDQSVDLIHSNNTFEHVYPDILHAILLEFKRVGRLGGLMSHFVDMSDHFAHFDTSINIYHFLRFSERAWQRIDNSVQPQNRLRYSEFLEMYKTLDLPITDTFYRPGNIEEVKATPLAEKFSNYALEDLAISHCHLYSKLE